MHFLAPKSSHLHPLHISPEEIRMGSSSLNLDVFSFIIAQSWGFVKPAQKVKRTRVRFSGPFSCLGFLGARRFLADCPGFLGRPLRLSCRPAQLSLNLSAAFSFFLLKKPRKNVKNRRFCVIFSYSSHFLSKSTHRPPIFVRLSVSFSSFLYILYHKFALLAINWRSNVKKSQNDRVYYIHNYFRKKPIFKPLPKIFNGGARKRLTNISQGLRT